MVIEENISESDYRLFPTQMKNHGDQKFADDTRGGNGRDRMANNKVPN